MVEVVLSRALGRYCGDRRTLRGAGDDIGTVLKDAVRDFPELERRILRPDGRIRPQILVYRDGTLLASGREGLPVTPGSALRLLQIVGGG